MRSALAHASTPAAITRRRRARATESSLNAAADFFDHIARAEACLLAAAPDYDGLLASGSQIRTAVRRFGQGLDAPVVRRHQEVVRRIVGVVVPRASVDGDATPDVQEVLAAAFRATESLATRAAFMVGTANGMRWALRHHRELRKRGLLKKGAA